MYGLAPDKSWVELGPTGQRDPVHGSAQPCADSHLCSHKGFSFGVRWPGGTGACSGPGKQEDLALKAPARVGLKALHAAEFPGPLALLSQGSTLAHSGNWDTLSRPYPAQ